jgi:hypothetical protein
MTDPTRAELLAFLEQAYPDATGGETPHTDDQADDDAHDGCPCRFDIEDAAYWLAAHHHGGQASNLYAALSASPYRPGACERDLPDDDERATASELYRQGAEWLQGCPTCGPDPIADRPCVDCGR